MTVFNFLKEVTISGFQLIILRKSILNLLYFLDMWIDLLYFASFFFLILWTKDMICGMRQDTYMCNVTSSVSKSG